MGSEIDVLVSEVLQGEELTILSRLSAQERGAAWSILQSLKVGEDNSWLSSLWQLDYDSPPPSPEEFFTQNEYFKHVGDSLHPKWKDELFYFLNPARGIREIVFRGCIGSGKSYVGAAITGYDLALLMLMKDPAKMLNPQGGEGSPIYYALISADLMQLERGLWAYTLNFLKRSPFFKKRSSIKEEKDYKGLELSLPKNIKLVGGSLPPHILGLNMFGCVMDESNYRRSADPQKEAYTFYQKIRNRVENRFISVCGKGRIVLISSEGDQGAFLDEHCNKIKAEQREGKSDAHVCQYSEWEIKGYTMNLPDTYFRVDIGDALRPPKVLEDSEDTRQGATVIEVPDTLEYRKAANRDLMSFLKDRAGVVPGRANKYFHNVQALLHAFERSNPVLSETGELALDSLFEGRDYIDENKFIIKIQGRYRPVLNPQAMRFIHIDLAKSQDLAGFSMVHMGGYSPSGSPIFYQDCVMGFSASAAKPIDYDKIIGLIQWLSGVGFNIAEVSYDSAFSQHSMNILDKLGYKVVYRSVDVMKSTTSSKSKIQPDYYEFRTMIAEERIQLVKSPLLMKEALELRDFDGYPDHDDTSSKDLIDATVGSIAGAVFAIKSVRGDMDANQLPPRPVNTYNRGAVLLDEKQLHDNNYDHEDIVINP